MHSSKIHTTCSGRLSVGWGGGVCPGGCLPRGCLPRGVSAWVGVCPGDIHPLPHYIHPLSIACWDTHHPVNRITDRCKNITLPQTSFAGSNKKLRPEGLGLHRFISEVVHNFSQT